MANLAGRTALRGPQAPQPPCVATEEWATRHMHFPADVEPPRNTLRGHPQPWRTRPVHSLQDSGPMHYSVKPVEGGDYTLCRGGPATGGPVANKGPVVEPPVLSSTAALGVGEWESRLANTKATCGLRGSIAPNWKPRAQEDMTGTGSVNLANWQAGSEPFVAPGTVTLKDVMNSLQGETGPTWSTAALARDEWEGRLDEKGIGRAL